MAQGKEWNKDEVIKILAPFFQRGCSVARACDYGGIPRTTVQTWVEDDEELRLKITAWQNMVSVQARENLAKKVLAGDADVSEKWLRAKEKDEWSNRTELAGVADAPLFGKKELDDVKKFEKEWFGDGVTLTGKPEDLEINKDNNVDKATTDDKTPN